METDGFEDILQYSEQGFTYVDANGVTRSASEVVFIIYVDWINDENNNDIDTEIGTSNLPQSPEGRICHSLGIEGRLEQHSDILSSGNNRASVRELPQIHTFTVV